MITRHKIGAAFAVAALMLGIGGGIAAAHTMGSAVPQTPAVQGPANGPAVDVPEPGDVPDMPGQPDLPEPGDVPDAPGQ
jgi:hypothetical protein